MKIEDLAIDHDYYCSDSNFYSNEPSQEYETFKDFFDDWQDSDIDLNLIFRWDVKKRDDDEMQDGYNSRYYLEIFMMLQRQGIFKPIYVREFKQSDVNLFIEYIKPHLAKLKKIWLPLI